MKRWIFSQSSLTRSAVAEECGPQVLAYLAIRLSTGSMFVTVWPYTFSKGWLPPPIQIGGGGRRAGLGVVGLVFSCFYFPAYLTLSAAPRRRPRPRLSLLPRTPPLPGMRLRPH